MILSPKYRSSDYCHKRELMTHFYLHQFRWVSLLFDHLTACEIYHHLALGIPQYQSLRTTCHGSLLHCWQICASLLQKIQILVDLGLAVSSNDFDFTKERPDWMGLFCAVRLCSTRILNSQSLLTRLVTGASMLAMSAETRAHQRLGLTSRQLTLQILQSQTT